MAQPLHKLIGARLREWRQAGNILQEDVAAHARQCGFDWVRGTVAMIESGRRRLTLEEFLALPIILQSALPDHPNVQLPDLIGRDGDDALLSPLVAIPANALREVLSGATGLDYEGGGGEGGGLIRQAPNMPEASEIRTLWRRWWTGTPDPGTLYQVALASRGDAEVKAARVLRVSPVAVALAALSRWDRSLTEERDARVAQRMKDSRDARARQALRGHLTRALLQDLRLELKAGGKPRQSTKRRARR